MTPHRLPDHPATEELLVGWYCADCGEWIPVVDPLWTECPGRPWHPSVGVLDSDGTMLADDEDGR